MVSHPVGDRLDSSTDHGPGPPAAEENKDI